MLYYLITLPGKIIEVTAENNPCLLMLMSADESPQQAIVVTAKPSTYEKTDEAYG